MKLPFWLIASALVNLVLIGFIAGFLLRPGADGRGPRHLEKGRGENIRLIGELTRDARRAMKPYSEAHRAAEVALVASLRKEPFDPADAREKFLAVRSADGNMKAAMDEALIAKLSEMSPDQRERVAKAISEGRERRHRRRGGDRNDDPKP
jgi:uncharacterized membrane protein